MRLGSDPEFFLYDAAQDQYVPSCGLIGADKWSPMQLPGLSTGFCIQEDNVAVEFNIPPCDSKESFSNAMETVREHGLNFVRNKANLGKRVTFSNVCAYVFPKELLEPHPQAMIFGCEPDYNAWNHKENPKPALKGKLANLRTCGGHVHVETDLPKETVIRAMDLFLGIPMVEMENSPATNGTQRRKLYGKFGAYRPKKYGVEYRTLSNAWCMSRATTDFVWDATAAALDAVKRDTIDFEELSATIQNIGNSGNREAARSLVQAFDLPQLSNYSFGW